MEIIIVTQEESFEHFRSRFKHAYDKIAQTVPEALRSGRFLDIGCGTGNGVAAAAAHGARFAIGVDRNLSEFAHAVSPPDFGAFCRRLYVPTVNTALIEMDIFESKFMPGTFDYALMLDSAEHVPNPKAFFQWAYESLAPGGCFVVDTCPLYYSPVGHHLWHWYPEDVQPWVHLKPGFEELCKASKIPQCGAWSWDRFAELNRFTHQNLRDAFQEVGWEITQEHRDGPSEKLLALFEKHGSGIDLKAIDKKTLFEQWILLVGRK